MSSLRRFILYLEPSPTSSIFNRLDAFITMTLSRFGPNSAQRYHPHCTITGFFDVTPSNSDPTLACTTATMVQALDDAIQKRLPFPPPRLTGFIRRKQAPGELLVGLKAPLVYHEVMDALVEAATGSEVGAHVRKKNINHISLALYPEKGEGSLAPEVMEEMERIARETVNLEKEETEMTEWDVVLYEKVESAEAPGTRYLFDEVKRWRVTRRGEDEI
ncbi:hypothetical protein BC936DRAFT_137319 [Jimgerdemannia flammicorona]|uniref:2',3'-cyclic-nucleotide 3'-phosphodiesterase n=1 Tax=Jimgerdemannia flammicorona TaxID=994334 RepID=A0A433CXM6_9FUNG|nr:hypothetical protein BC936DRAFT_137319 [Jimgerdemannia flammicorona]